MRTCHHYVVHKETRKAVFAHWDRYKCQAFLEAMENKEDYCLGYKWLSI